MYKFVDTHFSKIFDVAWMDNFNEGIDNGDGGADIGNKKKQMVEPRCEQAQRLVTEILNLAKTAHRQCEGKELGFSLSRVMTKLNAKPSDKDIEELETGEAQKLFQLVRDLIEDDHDAEEDAYVELDDGDLAASILQKATRQKKTKQATNWMKKRMTKWSSHFLNLLSSSRHTKYRMSKELDSRRAAQMIISRKERIN
jgi:hypothetical protein